MTRSTVRRLELAGDLHPDVESAGVHWFDTAEVAKVVVTQRSHAAPTAPSDELARERVLALREQWRKLGQRRELWITPEHQAALARIVGGFVTPAELGPAVGALAAEPTTSRNGRTDYKRRGLAAERDDFEKLWKEAAEANPRSHDEVLGRGDLDAQPARRMTDVEDERGVAQDPIETSNVIARGSTLTTPRAVSRYRSPPGRPIELALLGLGPTSPPDYERTPGLHAYNDGLGCDQATRPASAPQSRHDLCRFGRVKQASALRATDLSERGRLLTRHSTPASDSSGTAAKRLRGSLALLRQTGVVGVIAAHDRTREPCLPAQDPVRVAAGSPDERRTRPRLDRCRSRRARARPRADEGGVARHHPGARPVHGQLLLQRAQPPGSQRAARDDSIASTTSEKVSETDGC